MNQTMFANVAKSHGYIAFQVTAPGPESYTLFFCFLGFFLGVHFILFYFNFF